MTNNMKIYSVKDKKFNKYGRVVLGFNFSELLDKLKNTPKPKDSTIYVASDNELEKLEIFQEMQQREFGEMPIQIGYCNGNNNKLEALEYHRSSEINVALNDLILLIGSLQDVNSETYTYDKSLVEAFLVPAGTAVEIYATTLHYAPCNASDDGFRDVVILPKGTNLPLGKKPTNKYEDKLLFAKNKWLIDLKNHS